MPVAAAAISPVKISIPFAIVHVTDGGGVSALSSPLGVVPRKPFVFVVFVLVR